MSTQKKQPAWAERYRFALSFRQVFSAGFPVVNDVVNSVKNIEYVLDNYLNNADNVLTTHL